jgi:hypothetical protein
VQEGGRKEGEQVAKKSCEEGISMLPTRIAASDQPAGCRAAAGSVKLLHVHETRTPPAASNLEGGGVGVCGSGGIGRYSTSSSLPAAAAAAPATVEEMVTAIAGEVRSSGSDSSDSGSERRSRDYRN